MSFQFPAINYLYFLAFMLSFMLGVVNIRKDMDRGSLHWIGVLFSFSIWSLGELVANSGATLAWQLGFQRLVYLGVVAGVTNWLFFAMYYSGNQRWLRPVVMMLLLVVPASTLLLVATLEWHKLFYAEAILADRGSYVVLDLDYALGFWVHIALFAYPYTALGSALLLLASLRQPALYRGQSILIAVAATLPLIVNVLYVAGVDLTGGFDPTSVVFVFSAILITIAVRHYQFLRMAPIARDLLFRNINVGVAVLNQQQKITDVNPALARVCMKNADALVGADINTVFEELFDCAGLTFAEQRWQGHVMLLGSDSRYDINSMPIIGYQNEVLGTLVLFNDVTQIRQAMDEIGRMAHTDPLTQLPNRRALSDWVADLPPLETMVQPELVVMADLDKFKDLNDLYGHHCGDFVLQEISRIISAGLRVGDIVARWGGEEFCIVLTGKEIHQGEAALERLRKKIEAHTFMCDGAPLRVTMTFGMVCRGAYESLDDAIKRADMVMYAGKRQGRNRVLSSINK